eukprot:5498523-Prymnesium_polylepis.1
MCTEDRQRTGRSLTLRSAHAARDVERHSKRCVPPEMPMACRKAPNGPDTPAAAFGASPASSSCDARERGRVKRRRSGEERGGAGRSGGAGGARADDSPRRASQAVFGASWRVGLGSRAFGSRVAGVWV